MILWLYMRVGLVSILKMNVISMSKIIKKVGFSGWDGESWTTYRLLDRFWIHVNRRFRWPLISFKEIPF